MIHVYATTKNGDGHVQSLGEYGTIEDVVLYTDHFAAGVQITFVENFDKQE